MNYKLFAAMMVAGLLAPASNVLGLPSWVTLMIMILGALLVLANFIAIGKWVVRGNLDFWRKAKGEQKSEQSMNKE